MRKIAVFGGLAVVAGITLWWQLAKKTPGAITTFDACVAAGYPVTESLPRVCRTPDGGKFVEPKNAPAKNTNENTTNKTTNATTNSATNSSTPSVTSGDRHFGMGGGMPLFADQLDATGAEIVRVWIRWSVIEPSNDRYDWTEMDQIVSKANERDIDVLGFFYDQPSWSRVPGDANCNNLLKTRYPDPCAITDWAHYENFARDVADRYDGNHGHGTLQYIGIWNEVQGFARMTADDYKSWLERGYRAVKEGNPNVIVALGSSLAPLDFATAGDFLDVMLRDESQYFDIMDFHIYQTDDNAVGQTIADVKSRMDRYNVEKPMWITETAKFIVDVPCNNLAWQQDEAQSVIRRYAQALGNGVEAVFWYQFAERVTSEEDPIGIACGQPSNFALGGLNWLYPKGGSQSITELHPRPAATTFRTMTSKLRGYSVVEKITNTQYKFTVNGRSVYVLWCDSGSCALPSGISGQVTVTDYHGTATTQNVSSIRLTASPVFVE